MVGAIKQSVTGIGFGIFVMTLFPYFMPSYISAVTLSSSLAFTMTLYIVYKRRKDINFKLLVIPIMAYAISCAFCIALSVTQSDVDLSVERPKKYIKEKTKQSVVP